MSSTRNVILLCSSLVLAVAAHGCQKSGPNNWNLAPVEGTVTKGGQPLEGLRVTFLADVAAGTQGPRASGFTDSSGHFEIKTDGGDTGAAVGKYHVTITDLQATVDREGKGPRAAAMKRKRLLPGDKGGAAADGDKQPPAEEKPAAPKVESRVPADYGDWNKTPLKDIEVKPGTTNKFEWDVAGGK